MLDGENAWLEHLELYNNDEVCKDYIGDIVDTHVPNPLTVYQKEGGHLKLENQHEIVGSLVSVIFKLTQSQLYGMMAEVQYVQIM